MNAYLIICALFYNVHTNRCPSVSRLQLLGALGLPDTLKINEAVILMYSSFKLQTIQCYFFMSTFSVEESKVSPVIMFK
jgi:hypothetical protein